MSTAMCVSVTVACLLLSFLICVAIGKEMHKYDDFHLEAQKLIEQIENEADKKGQNASALIIHALNKLLSELRSS